MTTIGSPAAPRQRSKRPTSRTSGVAVHLAGAPATWRPPYRQATVNHIPDGAGDKFGLDEFDEAAAAAAAASAAVRSPSKGQRPSRSSASSELKHTTTPEPPLTGIALELKSLPPQQTVLQLAALRLIKLGLTLDEISGVFSISAEGIQELMACDGVAGA